MNIELLRNKIVDKEKKRILLANIEDTLENKDDICDVNCRGVGRIRHYKDFKLFLCNKNGKKRKLLRGYNPANEIIDTQVYQIVGCNWRCWYCFVDDEILSGNTSKCQWLTIEELIDTFLEQNLDIIDLSGGQPDLVPEWCLWVMQELEKRGYRGKKYIWLDDNLSTPSILESQLSSQEIKYMADYPLHSRACCFKGFSDNTIQFNIQNKKIKIAEQIKCFEKLYNYGFDLYAYITLTAQKGSYTKEEVDVFVRKIQEINYNLPLRIIPLEIRDFTATSNRIRQTYHEAYQEQYKVYDIWNDIMHKYYSVDDIERQFEEIEIR